MMELDSNLISALSARHFFLDSHPKMASRVTSMDPATARPTTKVSFLSAHIYSTLNQPRQRTLQQNHEYVLYIQLSDTAG